MNPSEGNSQESAIVEQFEADLREIRTSQKPGLLAIQAAGFAFEKALVSMKAQQPKTS